ncbi:hypothetical protein CIB48_g4791 [Xylaria polymorpha]|nr:hypothetical protein CIB48_g4791 [Xylaria polymorpha]
MITFHNLQKVPEHVRESALEAEPERKRARQDVTVKRRPVHINGGVVIPYSRRLRITTRLYSYAVVGRPVYEKAASLDLVSTASYCLDLRARIVSMGPAQILSRTIRRLKTRTHIVVGHAAGTVRLLRTSPGHPDSFGL